MNSSRAEISLLRIFLLFLKIGATGFGGNVALVATVRREICERRKLVPDEEILDGLTLGTVLPGALATNVIAYAGYRLRGLAGAMMALAGVLLPAFILICVLAELYYRHGDVPVVRQLLLGLIPALCGLIFATAIQMAQKNIRFPVQWIIVVIAAAAFIFIRGFWTTLLVMAVSGFAGWIIFRKNDQQINTQTKTKPLFPKRLFLLSAIVAVLIVVMMLLPVMLPAATFQQLKTVSLLGGTFGSMSLTLFGGGYVFVPAIGKVVVELHHWIPKQDFDLAIAFGQVTPGPIMISAAFIGWKVSGFWGAFVSTIFIFLPPALLMLVTSHFLDRIRGNRTVEAVFSGLRAGVIGMVFAAVAYVGRDAVYDWQSWVVFALSAFAVLKLKLDSAIIIPAGGLIGYLLFMI